MAGALDGIRVIDLTMWFQGPVAGQHLADQGAEVIHFENPKGGDLGRGVASIKALPVGDWNQYFLVINRNKKSMAVDLKSDAGRQVMYELVEKSDVFLTNLSAGSLSKWGVSYDDLSAINPRLVYAMGSGYGPRGTVTKPSFDLTVQALIGVMTRLGEPGQPPIYLGMGSGDAMGGLMAAFGITTALWAREKTGRGQFLDASLYGAQLFMAAPTMQAWLATGSDRFSRQVSRSHARNPTWNTYRASDRWLVVCVHNRDGQWAKLAGMLDELSSGGKLAADARFATEAARGENNVELVAELDRVFAGDTAENWVERLAETGLHAGVVCTLAELAEDEGAWANDYLARTHCNEVNREVMLRGLPLGLRGTPGTINTLGPELGQDTELILFETLGYDWDRIGELKSSGAIL